MTKILIVEDNPQNLKLATVILVSQGYEVRGATDSDAAEAEIRRELPELILMDLGLPGRDGYSLTRSLRDAATTRDIPIVALSSFAMRGDREKALAAGCTSYLSKPIRRTELLDEIRRLLPAAGSAP